MTSTRISRRSTRRACCLTARKFNGVAELRGSLARRPDRFVSSFTEKLTTYALGRGVTASDMPAIRTIVRDAAAADYKTSSLILGIVKSLPFQNRNAS